MAHFDKYLKPPDPPQPLSVTLFKRDEVTGP